MIGSTSLPAAARGPAPCEKPPYETCADQMVGGLYRHDPERCWWCRHGSAAYFDAATGKMTHLQSNPSGTATETSVVICPHGLAEVYCKICGGWFREGAD